MNLYEAGYSLGQRLFVEAQSYHMLGYSPEDRHRRHRQSWNLYGGKYDNAHEVAAYNRHINEKKKQARKHGLIGAATGTVVGAGAALAARKAVRGSALSDLHALRKAGYHGRSMPTKGIRKSLASGEHVEAALKAKHRLAHAMRSKWKTAAVGAGVGAAGLATAAYLRKRWSKHQDPHRYDERSKSYKPVK